MLSGRWKIYAAALAIAIVVVVIGWIAYSRTGTPSGRRDDAYAAQVAITDAKVSAAESMMGGGVVYYDGVIDNRGDRTLIAYTVDLTFHGIDGQPLDHYQRPLLSDHLRPIPPHTQRSFEIGFDKVPDGWNQAPPAPRAVAVYVR